MPLLDIFSLEQLPTIPYTQIQNVTADRLLGRLTTSGSIQELTAAQVRTLINVSDGANAYTLPTATSTVLGGVELFSDTVQTVAANAVTTTASRTYGIQVNSSGQMVVNIPWTDTVYTHPAYTARSIDTTGAQVIDVFTSDAIGSVTNITTRTMTLADLGYTGASNADNYASWLLAASGTAGTASITSGATVTLTAGTGMTVTRSTNNVTFATTITQYTDALARSAISLTTTGNSGAATYTSGTGVLNIPNYTLAGLGGFANPMTTLGDVIYGGTSGAVTRLAGNTTTTKQYLSQTGTGTVSAAPTWSTIAGSDITGAALTETDDTNVTLTLGGTPSTALLRAVSLTLGWTGQLAISRGGTGLSALGTANQLLRVNAGATALEYFTPSFLTAAITSLNGLTAATQTFSNDTNVTVTSATSTHTIGWSGQLSVSRGGTGASTLTGVLIGNGTSAVTAVAGTASQLLRRNAGNTAYEFFTPSFLTAAITSLNGLTAATQTFANDTNVTITSATSTHTIGWSGQLAVARGGTGASTLTGVLIGNGTSAVTAVAGTASQLLRRNAGNTAYEFFTPTYLTSTPTLQDVTNAGNTTTASIGIGTTTLPAKLAVVSAADYQGAFGSDNTHQILIGASTPYAELQGIRQNQAFDKNIVMQRLGGNVLIATGTDSGDKLRVNGTVRIDSVTNATGDIVTIDANSVLRRRTAAQLRLDIGAPLRVYNGAYNGAGSYVAHTGTGGTTFFNLYNFVYAYYTSSYKLNNIHQWSIRGEITFVSSYPTFTFTTATNQANSVNFSGVAGGSYRYEIEVITVVRDNVTLKVTMTVKLFNDTNVWQRVTTYDRTVTNMSTTQLDAMVQCQFSASNASNFINTHKLVVIESPSLISDNYLNG